MHVLNKFKMDFYYLIIGLELDIPTYLNSGRICVEGVVLHTEQQLM